jgi:hypothetical protein
MNINELVKKTLDTSLLDIYRFLERKHKRNSSKDSQETKNALTTEQKQWLKEMREDSKEVGPPFKPSQQWQGLVERFERMFSEQGIQNPENQDYNLSFSGFALGDRRLHRYVCWMYRSLLSKRDSLGLLSKLEATCKEDRGFGYKMEDTFLSLDLLFSIDDFYGLYELNPAVATEPIIVADLGAGWGRLGYVLHKVNPRCTYIVFDLPEILLVSQSYLPTLLQDTVVRKYDKNRTVPRFNREILRDAGIWFILPQDILRFDASSIDMIVNIASFQEMPVEYVAEYFKYFSTIAAGGHCFLRQLRDGKSHGHALDQIPGFNQYPFLSNWERKFLRSSTLSDEFFEVGFTIPPIHPALPK